MYLMSRFLIMTAQTKVFPMILVMTIRDVTVVMATSAGSDMAEEYIIIAQPGLEKINILTKKWYKYERKETRVQ